MKEGGIDIYNRGQKFRGENPDFVREMTTRIHIQAYTLFMNMKAHVGGSLSLLLYINVCWHL